MSVNCRACRSRTRHAFDSLEKSHSFSGYSYFECETCGTHNLDPVPDEQTLNGLYQSGKFETREPASRHLEPARFAADCAQYVSPLLPLVQKGRSLDFGCGCGWLVNQMACVGFDACGIEIEEDLVNEARQTFSGRFNVGAELPSGSFDVISSIFNLEHMRDPSKFVGEASHILRPGGILQIAVPTAGSLQFEMMGQHFFWAMAPFHVTLFTARGLDLMMTRYGFERVAHTAIERNWYWTKAIVDKLGLSGQYAKWRSDTEFVAFDIEIDRMFDAIAMKMGRPSSLMFFYRKY